jgi:hypothetical protein
LEWVEQATRLFRPATGRTEQTGHGNENSRPKKFGCLPIPSGGSPLGTGQWPVPPNGITTAVSDFEFKPCETAFDRKPHFSSQNLRCSAETAALITKLPKRSQPV